MNNFVAFLKKYLVLILCGIVVLGALGAGIWFLVNREQPNVPQDNTTESTDNLDINLDGDLGFGGLDVGNGSGLLPDGNTSSGDIAPINPDNQGNTNQGEGNQGEENQGEENQGEENQGDGNQGEGNQGEQESNTVEMSGSVVENPFK